ncbi:MAG: class I SAM-dependent methyltransferase [Candidatus Omnitrophica bacterium]|nr:class I SAM-dependent methyltransferase [Candidatus Omnitrophota bacterium]
MKTILQAKCNLCDSAQAQLVYIKDGIGIAKCKECGLFFNLQMKSPQDLDKIYSRDYFLGGDLGYGYDNYLAEKENYLRSFRKKFRLVEKYAQGGKLLSVGCGFGLCLDVARAKKWQTWGVEISKFACDWMKENLQLDVHNSTLKEARFPGNHFDAVLMWGYIQESLDPLGEIKEVYRILKPGGMLFIQTQNIDSLYARLAKDKWTQFKPQTTSYYFSKKTARLMLEKAHFQILEETSAGMGQFCSLGFLLSRFAHIFPAFKKMSATLGGNRLFRRSSVYINLFDLLHFCAKKEEKNG